MVKKSKKKRKQKERQQKALKFIIVVLVIHIILNIVRVPIEKETTLETNFVINNSPELIEEQFERQCFRKAFEWDFQWDGYNDVGAESISPRFILFNDEDRKGTFYVEFGFFDQTEYDFSRFRNRPYGSVINELPWDAAATHSENISVVIGANQQRLITSFTKKPNRDKPYWVYALVTEPSYNKCETVSLTINKTKSKPLLNETDKHTLEPTTRYISLWELIINWLSGK